MTNTTKADSNNGGERKGGITKFMKKCIITKVSIKKVLDKARKLYDRSFSGCAGQFSYVAAYGSVGTYPASHIGAVTAFNSPRSFSNSAVMDSSSDNDLRELIKAASIRQKKEESSSSEIIPIGKQPTPASPGINGVPRSQSSSVAIIGRIDEDSPCEFGSEEVIMVKLKKDIYQRSRSYAAAVPPNRRVSYSS